MSDAQNGKKGTHYRMVVPATGALAGQATHRQIVHPYRSPKIGGRGHVARVKFRT